MRWPRRDADGAEPDATSLLSRCRRHLDDDGSTIVVVTAVRPGADGASYRHHEQTLLPAARAAGLRPLHDVVPLDATDERDAFTYATDRRTDRLTGCGAPRDEGVTILVVFGRPRTTTATPHDRPDSRPATRRQQQQPVPVTRDTQPEPRDRHPPLGDIDERPVSLTGSRAGDGRGGRSQQAVPAPAATHGPASDQPPADTGYRLGWLALPALYVPHRDAAERRCTHR